MKYADGFTLVLDSGEWGNAYDRLRQQGVVFRSEPLPMGPVTSTVFEDTCGNLINLVQPHD